MREELQGIWNAIERMELPAEAMGLFQDCWDEVQQRFRVQESYLIDFKDRVPPKFSDDFGASIVRLSLAFHNSFGGIIVFGVVDRTLELSGLDTKLDVEAFNRTISDVTGKPIECLFRRFRLAGAESDVGVLLVPRRGHRKPLALNRDIGPYRAGLIWVRERHQVLEATPAHLPHLYSDRSSLAFDGESDRSLPIHRSLPPSPATMHNFIGRHELVRELWDWFVFGDQPRMYLHGPGGSGKSTLAFEFARMIAEVGFNIALPGGERVDYVLFLSAKETELNPLTGKQQTFALRQFDDALSQLRQLLYHSGHFDAGQIETADEEELEQLLTELFSSYSGLIVLDDIDALSRRKMDTGEELLFLKAVGSTKRTRILYTLRFPPSHARRNASEVPGLNADEFDAFLDACCRQFAVPSPPPEAIPLMKEETQSLPLLLETVVGLRRFSGDFSNALLLFRDKGGEEARKYLYQREYDQLDSKGKSREILATLCLIEEPVHFTTLVNLLNFPPQRVSDAVDECGSIFLATSESGTAETLYQLAPPSRPFIRAVSRRLDRFNQIERRVELLRSQDGAHTPAEAALIIKIERMLRETDHEGIVRVVDALPPHDPSLANPHIHALLGRAYAEQPLDTREKARESFRHASGLGLRDPDMMRAWYYLELRSGYGLEEAKRICAMMIDAQTVGPRVRSEFLSKRANCTHKEAISLSSVSREKAVPLFRESITGYLEAASIAQSVNGMDVASTLTWLDRPVSNLIRYLKDDLGPYLSLLEELITKKKDVGMEVAILLVQGVEKAYIPADARVRARIAGLFRRTAQKLDRYVKGSPDYPGLSYISTSMAMFSDALA